MYRSRKGKFVKYNLALIILSALPLAACGGDLHDNQSAANNQLEAAENVMWNDLANVSLENEATVTPPPAAPADTDSEPRPSAESTAPAPERSRTAPTARKSNPAPAAKPAPAPAPEPSPAQETCAPEHRAAGHC